MVGNIRLPSFLQTGNEKCVIEATPLKFLHWNVAFRFTGARQRDITLMGWSAGDAVALAR
jgi:hypothetical protein